MAISICSGLLASTMLLGQTANPPITTPSTTGTTVPYQSSSTTTQPQPQKGPIVSWFTREDRPVLSRIQGWFGRKDQKDSKDSSEPPVMQPTTTSPRGTTTIKEPAPLKNLPTPPATQTDFPRRMPNSSSQPASPTVPQTPVEPSSSQKSIPNSSSNNVDPTASKNIQQTAHNAPAPAGKSPILPKFANKIGRDEHFEWITGQLEIENGVHVIYYATPETVDQFHGRIVLQPQKVDMNTFHRGELVCVRGELIQRQTPQGMTATYRTSDMQAIERAK